MPANPPDITQQLVDHIVSFSYERMSRDAVASTKIFMLDSFGVGLSGSRVPFVGNLKMLAQTWGAGNAARIWATGERVPVETAAFINAYQIHNQEFDCVHEPAVVHPMAVVLASLVAHAEERGGVTGRELLAACGVAVDVATTIGSSALNRLRFFRPAMCGALGATAGIAALEKLDAATTRSALGIAYSQLSGTMQAHVEGSPVLPMQIGFNARASIGAVRLARSGVQGPRDFLEGPFGYFKLMDNEADTRPFADLGRIERITQLSHKPFPSGRATHGGVDGLLTLASEHRFMPHDIEAARVFGPPLVIQLVDRAPHADMAPSYARLCLPYVAATALLTGTVGVDDFSPAMLRDPARLALAARIRVIRDANPSLNALAPQRVEVDLRDGRSHAIDLPHVLGSPRRPLTRERHLQKFRGACSTALVPISGSQIEALIGAVDDLERLAEIRSLTDLLIAQHS